LEAKAKELVKIALRCFSSGSGSYIGETLLTIVEKYAPSATDDWKLVRDKLPGFLDTPEIRQYVLIQCCAALSHAFSNERSRLWDARVLYVKIQSALLRVLGLPIAGADVHQTSIEELDFERLAGEWRASCLFAEQLSILLVESLKQIFPVLLYPQELGRKVRLLSCYPVAVDGIQQMRIDLVTDDEVAGAKFGVNLRAMHQRRGLELPEQLQPRTED